MSTLTKTQPLTLGGVASEIINAAYPIVQEIKEAFPGLKRKVEEISSAANRQHRRRVQVGEEYFRDLRDWFRPRYSRRKRFPLFYPHYRKKVPLRLFMALAKRRGRVLRPFSLRARRYRPWRNRRYRYRRWY